MHIFLKSFFFLSFLSLPYSSVLPQSEKLQTLSYVPPSILSQFHSSYFLLYILYRGSLIWILMSIKYSGRKKIGKRVNMVAAKLGEGRKQRTNEGGKIKELNRRRGIEKSRRRQEVEKKRREGRGNEEGRRREGGGKEEGRRR